MNTINKVNRREFMTLAGKTGTALLLSGNLTTGQIAHATTTLNNHPLGVFVSINNQGTVEIICHRAEMGQGIMTSVPQIIAEELGADWQHVKVRLAQADTKYGNQSTGGSESIRRHFDYLRQMGAIARDMLEQAAAKVWQVDKKDVLTGVHAVEHRSDGRSLSFGELASIAATLKVPKADSVTLKDPSSYRLIGKDIDLAGLEKIIFGEATYAQDIQLRGMLIASIERPPVVLGKVLSFDASEAKKVPGVVDVIQLKARSLPVDTKPVSGVAVLAENTWAAIEGRKKLRVEWDLGPNANHDSERYKQALVKKVQQPGKQIRKEGDVYAHTFDANTTVEATYTVPYHHHMSMETPAATAVIEKGICRVWSGTQTPQWGKRLVMEELGLDADRDADKVEFNLTLMGGAFGRKGKNDFTLEAVELAQASGRPIKVIWTREDDVKHGYYHSIAANYFKADLNTDKSSDHWIMRVAAPPLTWLFNSEQKMLSDLSLSLGFGDLPFDCQHLSCENHETTTHVRTGWVRAVGNINNAFALGCFVDELAAKANITTRQMWLNLLGKDRLFDPRKEGYPGYTHYRQTKEGYLLDIARFKGVLNTITDQSRAEQATKKNEGWGISIAYSFNSYAAAATKVRVENKRVEVLEMHTAIDCGLVITPDRVRSQMEGAMIMGLSMALESEITVKDGVIVQNNFHDYPVSRIQQVPDLHVHIVPSQKPPGGVGEPGLPPVMPSIVNAIFHACGERIRDLPVKHHLNV